MKKRIAFVLAICLLLSFVSSFSFACRSFDRSEWGGPLYVRVNENDLESETGDYLLFGSYPQSVITDEGLKSALTELAGTDLYDSDSLWENNEYGWFATVSYEGERYIGMFFFSYLKDSLGHYPQWENGFQTHVRYWFRCEPIKWRILQESDGVALLLSEKILDSFPYYDSRTSHENSVKVVNDYALSDVRKWLNETFFDSAFTKAQKEAILLSSLENDARSTNPSQNAEEWNGGVNDYACESTTDRVFLLSMREVTDQKYGFRSDIDPFSERDANYDVARQKYTTHYAQGKGVYSTSSYYSRSQYAYVPWPQEGRGNWWLRSPSYYEQNRAFTISSEGTLGSLYADGMDVGVVPALRIRLS